MFVINKKDPSGPVGVSASMRMKRVGYRGAEISIMAIPDKKDKALCSPTSALEFGKG